MPVQKISLTTQLNGKMKRTLLGIFFTFCLSATGWTQTIVTDKSPFAVSEAVIYVDTSEPELLKTSAALLQKDIEQVTGKTLPIVSNLSQVRKNVIAIGTMQQSAFLKQLVAQKKISSADIQDKWEAGLLQTIRNPAKGIANALIIAGNDRRGAAYGVFELSKQMGVSPWYWWADVPVKKQNEIYIKENITLTDAPKVKYRGLFINDEAPALSGWTKEKFGGFNHQFYEKFFELILRLKGNYAWPAMWAMPFMPMIP